MAQALLDRFDMDGDERLSLDEYLAALLDMAGRPHTPPARLASNIRSKSKEEMEEHEAYDRIHALREQRLRRDRERESGGSSRKPDERQKPVVPNKFRAQGR